MCRTTRILLKCRIVCIRVEIEIKKTRCSIYWWTSLEHLYRHDSKFGNDNLSRLSFHAIAVDHPANETSKMQQPFNKLKVSLTHSNLSSALTIQSIGQPKLQCDDNSIVAYYSAKPGTQEFDKQLYDFVMESNKSTFSLFHFKIEDTLQLIHL